MNVVICYHGNCPDGFTAAWLIRRHLIEEVGHADSEIELVAARYGDDPPRVGPGDDVFVVDFCYEPEQLVAMIDDDPARLVVLDHHATSREWLDDYVSRLRPADAAFTYLTYLTSLDQLAAGVYEYECVTSDFFVSVMERSGAGLAAWFTDVEGEYPFVAYVEDRDLWNHNLQGTEQVFAAITSRPYTVEAWDDLATMSAEQLIAEGVGISRYRERLIEAALDTAHRVNLDGVEFWAAACPYAIGSDVAHRLAMRDGSGGFAGYYIDYGDRVRWGLRSLDDGPDVAKIAAQWGGGGHVHAAGFEIPS